MPPTFSVVIPTYNRADYLPQAVESVLSQTFADLELIIVDDGSIDGTADFVGGLDDERVQYIRQANQGRSVARNHGASQAQGQYLGFLDSDDRYLPTALAAHLQAFKSQPRLGMTIGGYRYADASGLPSGERWPWQEAGGLDPQGWLFNCYAMPGSVLLRRSWFDRIGGFDSECEIAEDWDLFLRLGQADCSMAWVKEAVCEYRRHPGNSIEAVGLHRQGAERALDKYFRRPGLEPVISALEGQARAWVYVVSARKAYSRGRADPAAQDLGQALRLDPELQRSRKVALLEFLLTPDASWGPADSAAASILAALPPALAAKPGDVRRALARVEMSRFFRAAGRRPDAEALRHLKAGVARDPRWLANRGVWAFGVRALMRSLQPRG